MRMIGAMGAALFVGCASAPVEPVVELELEKRIAAARAQRPDDPDLLFFRHNEADLGPLRRLAELRPEPVVYSRVIDEYLGALTFGNLKEFEGLLRRWIERDPDNALPRLLKGLAEIAWGNFDGGLRTIMDASQRPVLKTYGREVQRETLRILKKEGWNDVYDLGAAFALDNFKLSFTVQSVSRMLRALGTWSFLQGDLREARRMAEADHRLGVLLSENAASDKDWLILDCIMPWSAERLCELDLMMGDTEAAERHGAVARHAWVEKKTRDLAIKRALEADPVVRLYRGLDLFANKEAGKMSEDPEEAVVEVLNEIVDLVRNLETNKELMRALLRAHEAEVRPSLEAQATQGIYPAALELLTDDDRRSLASMKAPIDSFMEWREVFYPATYGPEHRDRLVAFLTEERGEEELREFLQERAGNALIHHRDRTALPALRKQIDREGTGFDRNPVAVAMVALGEKDSRVHEELWGIVPAATWALVRLKRKDLIPEAVRSLRDDARPEYLFRGFSEAIVAYLALRELTGQQFGFDGRRWREWAKAEGYPED